MKLSMNLTRCSWIDHFTNLQCVFLAVAGVAVVGGGVVVIAQAATHE